jgi:hypothetical protein
VNYDHARGKASYVERDLLKNSVFKTGETAIPACVSDIIGGLYKLRSLKLEPGQSTQLAISDGKKSVSARVEAQQREQIKTQGGTFNTIRYEVFVFNGVLLHERLSYLSGCRTTPAAAGADSGQDGFSNWLHYVRTRKGRAFLME